MALQSRTLASTQQRAFVRAPFRAASSASGRRCTARAAASRHHTSQPVPVEEPSFQPSAAVQCAASGLAVALLGALIAEPALAHQVDTHAVTEQFQLAEGQEFWGNIARYGRYFVTVMLGTGYVMLRPFANAFKNPISALLAIAAVVGAVVGTKVTLEAMLGMTSESFEYVQGQF